ncbi:MAG: cupredoxin domain-containing protein [Chloroflexi bacterium]|nr:cupredoxin domain-containing protein [Chloroflexota bacterium]
MKTQTKLLIVVGITAALVLALVAGGWFINTAFAQGPWQGGNWGAMHNNQAVLDLLKTNANDLLQQRQQGKSWLDIASAKGVSEQALTDALLQPVTQMHAWMAQNYPQANAAQMTEWMRQQIAQDIRVAQYGTMTDMHVFAGSMMNAPHNGARMGNWNGNGYGGMMGGWNGNGMMGNWNGANGFGGMMNGGMMGNWNGTNGFGGMMGGGMMGGWNNAPSVNATPVPSTQSVDKEINLTARNFKFDPTRVEVKKGETIKFKITNQDNFAHNAVSQDGKLVYTVLPANQTTSVVWTAPNQTGTYTIICTWHPGMQFQIVVV